MTPEFSKQAAVYGAPIVECSATQHEGIPQLINSIAATLPSNTTEEDSLTAGLVKSGDTVVLVMPQDSEAPEGRLIRPQAQLIRDLLDRHFLYIMCRHSFPHFH